jgi:hypothetical protein
MAALSTVAWVFIAVTGLFYAVALMKPHLKNFSVCSICLAVSLTWVGLFALRQFGLFENEAVIALLLGQSVVGGYYLWERRAPRDWLVFRLPVLLVLSFAAWSIVALDVDLTLLGLVALTWAVHGFLYAYRTRPSVKSSFDNIIACCSRW